VTKVTVVTRPELPEKVLLHALESANSTATAELAVVRKFPRTVLVDTTGVA
jgi:hypothetical protein